MIDITKKISKVTVNGQEMALVGVDVADTTAVSNDVLAGKTFYGADELKKTGTIETYSGDTEISVGDTDKIVNTAGKYVSDNITIKAIDIYGLGFIPREISTSGVYQLPSQNFTFTMPNEATSVGEYALRYAFYGSVGLTSVDLKNVTSVGNYGMQDMCTSCLNLTTLNLSNVTSVGNYGMQLMCYRCTNLTTLNLSNVTSVGSNGMQDMCSACTSLKSLSFPALTTNSFGGYSNQFNNMLTGCSGVTVHFPASIRSKIGSWSSVTSGFGGTNTTVLFDL